MSKSVYIKNIEMATKEDLVGYPKQVPVMPQASESNLGEVVQFIGDTTNEFTCGGLYKSSKKSTVLALTTTADTSIPLDFALDDAKYSVEFDIRLIDLSRNWGYMRLMFSENSEYNSSIYFTKTNAADLYMHCGCGGSNSDVFVYTKPEYRTKIIYNKYSENYGSYICSFNENEWIISGFNGNADTSGYNITLFNSHTSGEGTLAELYGFKVYDNSDGHVLVHDMIPAIDPTTSHPALYDTITDTYYLDTSNTMVYTPNGFAYYWEEIKVGPYVSGRGTIIKPYNPISDDSFYTDLKNLAKYFDVNNTEPQYVINNLSLSNIYKSNFGSYVVYFFIFSGLCGANSTRVTSIYIYKDSNGAFYSIDDPTYYPRWDTDNTSTLAYEYSLGNYLSKDNTYDYIPIHRNNPATKGYVDDIALGAIKQREKLGTPEEEGILYQYIGNDTNEFKNGRFYISKDLGATTAYLQVNSPSCYYLNYTYQDTDRLEISFLPTMYGNDCGILGNEEGSYTYMEIHFNGTTFYIGSGVNEYSYAGYEQDKLYNVIINDDNGDIVVNDVVWHSEVEYGSNGTLKLCEYSGNTDFRGKFYYLRIYDKTTGNLKKEWIPALDNGIVCLKETVSNTYVYNNYTEDTPNVIGYDHVYSWELYTKFMDPIVVNNVASTYTIDSLKEHMIYNLGEITSLTISDVDDIYLETDIFLESGSTATTVNMPDDIVNVGDYPTMMSSGGVASGTLTANKNYIISFLNGMAIWKEY